MSFAAIRQLVKKARQRGLTVVTTNGCFDILHTGHARYLEWAKRQGDVLIVGVNSDASVRKLKGAGRPINPQTERAEIVAALRPVDAVFIFDSETPEQWLAALKPDIHVKGADRSMQEIIEKETVEKNGGIIKRAPYHKGRSTSALVKKVRS
jgi:rfaE bifunctional protein nucleotidyltransferase chain/domain